MWGCPDIPLSVCPPGFIANIKCFMCFTVVSQLLQSVFHLFQTLYQCVLHCMFHICSSRKCFSVSRALIPSCAFLGFLNPSSTPPWGHRGLMGLPASAWPGRSARRKPPKSLLPGATVRNMALISVVFSWVAQATRTARASALSLGTLATKRSETLIGTGPRKKAPNKAPKNNPLRSTIQKEAN